MRKEHLISIISLLTLSALVLCGCKSEPVSKTRFGQVDAMEDGPVLANINGEPLAEGQGPSQESLTVSTPLKTAKSLDVDDLPENIEKMIGLCDAINMVCVEKQKTYTADDDDFMWHCIHVFVGSCTDRKMGLERVGSYIEADQETIRDIMFAMFGKLREVPQIPESAMSEADGGAHISMGANLKYRFSGGDRGLSVAEVRRVTQYSDGSLEMEVALVDQETKEETVCFIYSMRANTKDTTTSARFAYEITGARSADKATSDKINGMPYLVPVIQVYGYDSYEKDDPKYKEVIEVLQFASFSEHVPGMEELDKRISEEIIPIAYSEDTENGYKKICSYPVTSGDVVQVATSVTTFTGDTADQDIRCYNYDVKKSRILDENDALAIKNTTRDKMNERIVELWEKGMSSEGTVSQNAQYRGFLIRKDGSGDLFYRLDVTGTEGDAKKIMIAYNTQADAIRIIKPEDNILPSSETDETRPRLTHGAKD